MHGFPASNKYGTKKNSLVIKQLLLFFRQKIFWSNARLQAVKKNQTARTVFASILLNLAKCARSAIKYNKMVASPYNLFFR